MQYNLLFTASWTNNKNKKNIYLLQCHLSVQSQKKILAIEFGYFKIKYNVIFTE